MSAFPPMLSTPPAPPLVLSRAVARAAERLGVSRAALAGILGVSLPKATRLLHGTCTLDRRLSEWDLALLFVRVFHSLDSIVGNHLAARRWLESDNRALNGRPVELIGEAQGLARVARYLDVCRRGV